MKQIEPPVVFVRIDDQLIRNRRHERRAVLTNAMQANFGASKFEMVHRRNALDSLNHAGSDGGKKQLGRIECVETPVHIGIKRDLGFLAARGTPMGIHPFRDNVLFKHSTPLVKA